MGILPDVIVYNLVLSILVTLHISDHFVYIVVLSSCLHKHKYEEALIF